METWRIKKGRAPPFIREEKVLVREEEKSKTERINRVEEGDRKGEFQEASQGLEKKVLDFAQHKFKWNYIKNFAVGNS